MLENRLKIRCRGQRADHSLEMLDRSCGFIHHGLGRSAFLGQTVAPFSWKAYARSETLLSVEAAHPGPLDLNLGFDRVALRLNEEARC